jgi:hypothetical protein
MHGLPVSFHFNLPSLNPSDRAVCEGSCSCHSQTIMSPSSPQNGLLKSNTANVLSALGTLIGYIGTEVATGDLFERLLWPQRFYNGFTIHNAWKLALLMPMGGPLHKAALQTLDKFFKNGLFKGDSLGRMLGTAFFHDSKIKYTVHEESVPPQQEHVRNGLWVRAVDEMPVLVADMSRKRQQEDGVPLLKKVRQKTTVSRLILSRPTSQAAANTVSHDSGPVRLRTYVALILTETTGIATAIAVMAVWRSWFMLLWVSPLALKLLSAAFALRREDLAVLPERKNANNEEKLTVCTKKYEIANSGNGFLVVEGEDSIVLQFFRHYAHPIRACAREKIQMAIIVAFGFVFPVGLLCSLVWMPIGLQYVWLSYQLYATIAMHIYRYARGHQWATTEEMICQKFAKAEANHEEPEIVFGNVKESSLVARLVRTPHDSYAEGRAHIAQLLSISEDLSSACDAQRQQLRRTDSEASTESAMSVNSNGTSMAPLV